MCRRGSALQMKIQRSRLTTWHGCHQKIKLLLTHSPILRTYSINAETSVTLSMDSEHFISFINNKRGALW